MYDFDKLFSDDVQVFLGGLIEYHKQYEEIESKMLAALLDLGKVMKRELMKGHRPPINT